MGQRRGQAGRREAPLGWKETKGAHLPDVVLADGTDEVLDTWLREMLLVVSNQFAVDGWHCHEDVDPGGLEAQEGFPDLEGREGMRRLHHLLREDSRPCGRSHKALWARGSAPGRTQRGKSQQREHQVIREPNHKPALSPTWSRCLFPIALGLFPSSQITGASPGCQPEESAEPRHEYFSLANLPPTLPLVSLSERRKKGKPMNK